MQYEATPFYNENEKRAKIAISVVCSDGEREGAEIYADEVTSAEEVKAAALNLIVRHEQVLAERLAKEQEARTALESIVISVIPPTPIEAQEVEDFKVVLEAKRIEAEKLEVEKVNEPLPAEQPAEPLP